MLKLLFFLRIYLIVGKIPLESNLCFQKMKLYLLTFKHVYLIKI